MRRDGRLPALGPLRHVSQPLQRTSDDLPAAISEATTCAFDAFLLGRVDGRIRLVVGALLIDVDERAVSCLEECCGPLAFAVPVHVTMRAAGAVRRIGSSIPVRGLVWPERDPFAVATRAARPAAELGMARKVSRAYAARERAFLARHGIALHGRER